MSDLPVPSVEAVTNDPEPHVAPVVGSGYVSQSEAQSLKGKVAELKLRLKQERANRERMIELLVALVAELSTEGGDQ